MLNDDSYHTGTGTAKTPVCDCGEDNETVSQFSTTSTLQQTLHTMSS